MSQQTSPEEPPTCTWTLTGYQVNLYADDVETAIAFYKALAFDEKYRYPATRYTGARRGSERWSHDWRLLHRRCSRRHGFDVSRDGSSVEIVLWCDDADAAYAQALAAGATVLREPYDFQNGRLHVARVFDLLGYRLVLVEKRDTTS
jgi:predicted enzyme related to lactoylglutathione lyase